MADRRWPGRQLLHGARRMADLKADVPEHVEDMLNEVVDLARVAGAVVRVRKRMSMSL